MVLYEILCISAHAKDYSKIRDLVRQTALGVMNQGGVVRSVNSWGTRTLPTRMRSPKDKQYHAVGDYWTVHFDASPTLLKQVEQQIRHDPRVLRWTTTKLGERLPEIAQITEDTVRLTGRR